MTHNPGYLVIAPFASLYTLLLFLPTIDALAIMQISIFTYKVKFSIGALLFPAIFPMSDSLTEVYNKNVAYNVVFSCYAVMVFISITHHFLLSKIENNHLYQFMINPSLIITIAGTFSYIVTSYININLINKLKFMLRSKHFIIRSLICSSISGFIMSLIVQLSLNYRSGFHYFLNIFISTYFVKLVVTIPYAYAAKALVLIYRYIDNIPPELFNEKLTLFSFKKDQISEKSL